MTPEERMDRLEKLAQTVVDGRISLQKNLDNIIADLAEMTRKGLDETLERFEIRERVFGLSAQTFARHTEMFERHQRMVEQDRKRMAALDEIERQRSRELDERIAGLVSAISELIRRWDEQKGAN